MEGKQEQEYKLVQAVDPRSKKKVPIRDRFAKLTLSSNKKRQEGTADQESRTQKRDSASRNLMKELCDTKPDAASQYFFEERCVNRLLRSESSSQHSVMSSKQNGGTENIGQADNNCSETTMEHLHVSNDTSWRQSTLASEVEELSQKLATMGVDPGPLSTYTKATRSINTNRGMEGMPLRKCEDPVVAELPQDVKCICISSSSSDKCNGGEQSDEETPITISDSSASVVCDNEMLTSADGALLPYRFSNEKIDRIKAFLRDVSMERREIECNRQLLQNANKMTESVRPEMYASDGNVNDNFDLKAHQLATADTESMTPDDEDNNRKQQYNTTSMSQTLHSVSEMAAAHDSITDGRQQREMVARRLAEDITESNTITSFAQEECDITNESHNKSRAKSDISNNSAGPPVESVVISETSSEEEDVTHREKTVYETTSCEVISSEQKTPSNGNATPQSQISQIQMNMGSINISAKINIKIHIGQQSVSSSEDDNEGDENKENIDGATISNNEANESQEKDESSGLLQQDYSPSKEGESECSANKTPVIKEDERFMNQAEKLLTQIYGNTWRTPEVMRSLKRPNRINNIENTSSSNTCRNRMKVHNRVEESILDDFSIFKHDIAKTNLDSTRVEVKEKVISESEQMLGSSSKRSANDGKISQTKSEKSRAKTVVTTKRGRCVKKWWRPVGNNSDSEVDNASDDEDADKTEDVFSASDESWKKSPTETSSDDDDLRRSPRSKSTKLRNANNKAELVYLDLSKEEVSVQEDPPASPPVNHDELFASRLQEILRTCRHEDRPKMFAFPSTGRSKRKLFTPNFGDEDLNANTPNRSETPKLKSGTLRDLNNDNEYLIDECDLKEQRDNLKYQIFNRHLEAIKKNKPIFQLTPTKRREDTSTPKTRNNDVFATPKTAKSRGALCFEPGFKYGFLRSLDVCVSRTFCHPEALYFRENYRQKKEELSKILYDLYNKELFENKLNVPLVWNKKLLNTAGRCLNKKKFGERTSVVELSEKVLTSADRLRCTLLHELCHAATWIFSGEGGHGATWKQWARRANSVFPEIPKMGVCHQYEIEYKYTYKCTLCGAKSHAHSKSKKVENIRCSYCHGAIEIFINKKDKEGNILPTPVKEATGFAKFVKDNYKKYKRDDLKHADIMKLLSNDFAALKVSGNAN